MSWRLRTALMLAGAFGPGAGCASANRPASGTGTLALPGVSTAAATDDDDAGAASGPSVATASATAPVSATSEHGATGTERAGDGRVSLPEDLPPGTRSLQVREIAHVLVAPLDRAPYIGKITAGTRVAWQRIVAPDPEDPEVVKKRRRRKGEPCTAWVELRPTGFLCKTLLAPSREEPHGTHQPVVAKGRLTPDDYFKVMADETKVYKSADDVRGAVVDKLLSTKVMLVGEGVLHIDETPYLKTDHGFIEAALLGKFSPSDFAGVDLRQPNAPKLPFAWVFFERGGKKPPIYADPTRDGKPVRDGARREIVPVLEERDGFVRIGDGEWLERKHLRFASVTTVPVQVSGSAQWVDVNLDEQVLIAYEGPKPVFVTLVSTGGPKNPTPTATYRVRAKAATTPMNGDAKVPNHYEVSAVPWAVRFASGLFVHGVYWHDGFGGARSHGCVNVSPRDAAFFYEWVGPPVPEGWSELEVPGTDGVIVRIRSQKDPDPPLFDYAREAPREAVAL